MNRIADKQLAIATVNLPSGQGNYYLTVHALTPKVAPQTEARASDRSMPAPGISAPWLLFVPFLVFFAVFIAVFGMQVANKTWNMRRTVTALVLALFAAAIPYVLTSVREGTGFQSKAGPDEVPRNVRVAPLSTSSVLVVWETDADKVGAVRYGLPPLSAQGSTVVIGDVGKKVTRHTVKLDNLKPRAAYDFEIFSGTIWYSDNGKPLTFRLK